MNAEATGAGVALALVGVTKVYGCEPNLVTALDDVSLEVRVGTFTAVMGPSGSGKSTFLQCAAGLERPTSGTVAVDGLSLHGLSDDRLTRLRRSTVGFVFQSFHLLPYLTAYQNVALPLRLAHGRIDRARVTEVLASVSMDEHRDKYPAELSGGQQQRVAVARALVARPAVLFADEPTGALDSASAREVLALLQKAARSRHQTIVMVTHDPMAASYADSVIFVVDGTIADRMHHPTADAVAAQMTHLGDIRPMAGSRR